MQKSKDDKMEKRENNATERCVEEKRKADEKRELVDLGVSLETLEGLAGKLLELDDELRQGSWA